jgi:hypothetical protein
VLPTIWVPSAIGTCQSATAEPDPDGDPPGVRFASCGFRQGLPTALAASSVVVVFAKNDHCGCPKGGD